jgi:hypothetical protein
MRKGACGCLECKPIYGLGKTKEAAIEALLAGEQDELDA